LIRRNRRRKIASTAASADGGGLVNLRARRSLGVYCAGFAACVLLSLGVDSGAQSPPGCPPAGDPADPSCTIFAEPVGNDVNVIGFTPGSTVEFEVLENGTRVSGPVRGKANNVGVANAELRPPGFDLKPGHEVRATDGATGTEKKLVVSPVKITAVDHAANSVSGRANPGERVRVVLDPPHDQSNTGRAAGEATAGQDRRWTVGFADDVTAQSRIDVFAFDADGDRTGPRPIGCPPVPGRGNCVIDVHIDGDFIFASMSPDSEVEVELFSSPGGSSIYGPFTHGTDDVGTMVPGHELAFDGPNPIDLVPGMQVVARDGKSRTVKRLVVPSLFIDRVDPETDVVEGRAPPDSELSVAITGSQVQIMRADASGTWRVDFRALFGYDVTYDHSAFVGAFDADGDVTYAERGAPLLDCVPDADTVCGTAGTETLRTSEAPAAARILPAASSKREVKAGGGTDTVLVRAGGAIKKVDVDTGKGKVDKVVVRPGSGTARPTVVIAGRSRRMVVVLPADAGKLIARVTGTNGGDRVYVRRFRSSAGSGGGYRIAGGKGNDSLRGGNGRDTLNGGAGRDTCFKGNGDTVKSCEVVVRV
jgi:Ca2+-binding RTX toxin-like protein